MTTPPETERRSIVSRLTALIAKGSVQITLIVVAFFWLVPGLGLLITSLRPVERYSESGWWTALNTPGELTLQNYANLVSDSALLSSFTTTVVIAVANTVLVVILAAMAGYALAWIPFKGRDALFLIIVGMLVVPLQMALIPAFQVFGLVGLRGIPAVVLFHTAFGLPFAVFLMRNYFASLPGSLLESARMDGASEWRIFTRIVLPLGFPALASLTIFQFTWTWNDLLVALVFAGEQRPLTLFLRDRLNQFSSGIDVIAPGVFLSAIVPLIIFFAFQRYFEAGLLGGSVK
jgi:alpha-glucoside transport system permease protein